MNLHIEVAVPDGTSTTERGRLLEQFGSRFLKTQGFSVVEEVRLTGLEVDLLASAGPETGERVFVECKAQRAPLAAEVLMKLLGQVMMKQYSSGWLLSASPLSKDAKGIDEEWQAKPSDERRQLQIYTPDKLVRRLVGANIIIDPVSLPKASGKRYSDDNYLLIAPFGEFWALVLLDEATNLRSGFQVFDAATGQLAHDGIAEQVRKTDATIADLELFQARQPSKEIEHQKLSEELQSIVPVQVADDWADYRPSRPEDFVGRDQLQQDVLQLFDSARSGTSSTRLFAVKAPSGWGKSSFVLKIAQRAAAIGHGRRNFVYAVDSRAASSQRFAELALYSAVQKAAHAGFIDSADNLEVGGADAPFASDSMREMLAQLQAENKIICLIFDQFEELLYKENLAPLFKDIRLLCDAVVEAQANFVIGFSWKTDGTIPPEHEAYYLWHNLSDRRREFELTALSESDVNKAINRFSKELNQPVAPQLRRVLHDHSQGFPWLLKKLCIHVLQQVNGGLDQGEVLVRALRIEDLFKKDLEGLAAPEFDCIKKIAEEAPADFYKISRTYGDAIVNQLLDKRLIIRSGARLSIYWDIFREYVLDERVPYIPTTYVPQANIRSYLKAVQILIRDQKATYGQIATELGVSPGTADNIVRDLVMVGHAEANRQAGEVFSITDEEGARAAFVAFCESHTIYRSLDTMFDRGQAFTADRVIEVAREVYGSRGLSERVSSPYARRLLTWLIAAGLARREGHQFLLTKTVGNRMSFEIRPTRRSAGIFLGGSTPAKLVSALEAIGKGASLIEVEERYGRYPISDMLNLDVIDENGKVLNFATPVSEVVARAVRQSLTYATTAARIKQNPGSRGIDIGRELAEQLNVTWTDASCARNGSSLLRWVRWADEVLEPTPLLPLDRPRRL